MSDSFNETTCKDCIHSGILRNQYTKEDTTICLVRLDVEPESPRVVMMAHPDASCELATREGSHE